MVYNGHFENGVVVFDELPDLVDGTKVQIVPVGPSRQSTSDDGNKPTLAEKLLRHSGTVDGLPEDASENLDHYLYGTPKR